MTTNPKGLALIKGFESCRLKAYPDPGTGGKPWTIGWGHTAGVVPGLVMTQAQADASLVSDLAKYEHSVESLVTVELTSNQFSALVSFCFNCGGQNLARSRLLRFVNARKFAAASAEFARWNRAAGRVMAGLTRRRRAERDLFLSPDSLA